MCTVSYYILENNSIVLTSNRDERAIRPTSSPLIKNIDDINILFPKDMEAGGSWIATADNGRSACLLNGAFEPHVRNPPYRKSRGLVLLESYNYSDLHKFCNSYDFDRIEPFTLIFTEFKKGKPELAEFRWDGKDTYLSMPDPAIPHLWCSAPLYSKSVRAERLIHFRQWNEKEIIHPDKILQFHFAGEHEYPPFTILLENKYGLKTVSVTQLVSNTETTVMRYFDRVHSSEEEHLLRNALI